MRRGSKRSGGPESALARVPSTKPALHGACRALVELVKTITPDQLRAFGWSPESSAPAWKTPTLLSPEELQSVLEESEAPDAP